MNLSLLCGVVPKMTKLANIIPILKSGDENNMNNSWPISILPPLSKVLEIETKKIKTKIRGDKIKNYLQFLRHVYSNYHCKMVSIRT